MLIDFTNPFLDLLFPKRCLICLTALGGNLICQDCLSQCHPCPNPLRLKNKKIVDAIFFYEFTIRMLIQGAKFHKNDGHLCLLKQLIEQSVRSSSILTAMKNFDPDAICFIPSHFVTNIFRGPEIPRIFAQILAREISVPHVNLLKRRRFNDHQAARSSKSERLQAIKGAFILRSRSWQKCSRLLVVDDIVTTGATFAEAKKVLKPLAQEIYCLAIAKTP